MKRLAFLVMAETDQRVVFASDQDHAYELGQAELGGGPCVVHRDERFDAYSPGPVPAKKLVMEHGWTLVCDGCGHGIWREKMDVEGKTPVFIDDQAFCCKACKIQYLERQMDTEDQVNEAVDTILEKCPDAKILRYWTTEDRVGTLIVTLQFSFPGGTDPAIWQSSSPGLIKLSKDDNEVWLDYKKSGRVH